MDNEAVQGAIADKVETANRVAEYIQSKLPLLIDFGVRVLISILVFFIGRKVIKILLRLVRKPFVRAGLTEDLIRFMDSLIKVLLYVMLIAGLAMYLGIQGATVAALIGSVGLGLALALKESLTNLAGGFLLLVTKPFLVGDYIKEDNKANEGTVVEIALLYTTLRTADNQLVHIPNGILANTSITVNQEEKDKK